MTTTIPSPPHPMSSMATTSRAPALVRSMRKWLLLVIAFLLMIPVGTHVYRRCLAAGAVLNQGQSFYVLTPGTTASCL